MHRVPVFYVPEQATPNADSYSTSAGKPARVIADWHADDRIAAATQLCGFDPVSANAIAQAHEATFVADVLACRRSNGFDNRDPKVAASLPYTSGSRLAAALHVLGEQAIGQPRLAYSPTSGFNHAHHSGCRGFCTRDRLVFRLAVRHGVPLVWNLAGDYQRDARGTIAPVLALHRSTVRECISAVNDERAP